MSRISPQLQQQEAQVRRQRRLSSISSVLIALLVMAVLMLVLGLVLLPSMLRRTEPIVSYTAPQHTEERIRQRMLSQTRSKPSAPSMSAAKVIAASAASPTAIPVPDFEPTEPSVDFGNGDDFGEGWDDGGGDGLGRGGSTTFFRHEVKAKRICYVIDYSLSMSGQRDRLMRDELTKSVSQLGAGTQYQMIFFAGPAWEAGWQVTMADDRKTARVEDGRTVFKWDSTGNAHRWEPKGRRQKPGWISAGPHTLEASLKMVKDTPLEWGTNWENPLEMAVRMDPPPEIIFFMTDGAVAGDMVELGRRLGARAKAKDIVVNTVAMMQPDAEGGMKELARRTGGQFSVVRPGGEVEVVPME